MNRAHLSVVLFLAAAACSNRKQDPPPPAGSVVVPMGAPRAIGAMAAGRTPAPTAAPTVMDDPDIEDDEAPPVPTPPLTPVEPDSGVTL